MCIALPLKVIRVGEKDVLVQKSGRFEKISNILFRGKIKKGDFVIVENNLIIGKADKKDAKELFDLIEKID